MTIDMQQNNHIQRNKGGAPRGNQNAKKPTFVGKLLYAIRNNKEVHLDSACQKLLEMAASGDLDSIKFLAEKLDGKTAQAVEIMGQGGGPVQISARPTMTVEEWLSAFAPGMANVIEGEAEQVKQLEEKR